jgi:hypothetical protein
MTSVTKAFTLKGVQIINRSVVERWVICMPLNFKGFHNTRHSATFGITIVKLFLKPLVKNGF